MFIGPIAVLNLKLRRSEMYVPLLRSFRILGVIASYKHHAPTELKPSRVAANHPLEVRVVGCHIYEFSESKLR
jgi:hypothetical protein